MAPHANPQTDRVEMRSRPPVVPRTLRIPFVRRCTLTTARAEQSGMILDISIQGAYIHTDPLPNEGDSLTVSFRVPENDRLLNISGLVAWVNRYQAHPVHSLPPGFGMSFVDVSGQDKSLIAQTILGYCRSHPLYQQYL